ncbi:MAG: adenine-specific methyltransferase EcoRI family protein [Spirochaetia bacterium]|nr:adenine-specific methyltransferase EcoRI family protein [Spirochaetia bacterium]
MANDNKFLTKAKKAKSDDYYTQLTDIERELKHYKHHFNDKTVFCNCDDPRVSNFGASGFLVGKHETC